MDVDIPVPDISSPTSELTLSEETIKRILLKYACVAIRCGVKDPITLAFSEGIRSHLSKHEAFLIKCAFCSGEYGIFFKKKLLR